MITVNRNIILGKEFVLQESNPLCPCLFISSPSNKMAMDCSRQDVNILMVTTGMLL